MVCRKGWVKKKYTRLIKKYAMYNRDGIVE